MSVNAQITLSRNRHQTATDRTTLRYPDLLKELIGLEMVLSRLVGSGGTVE